MVNTSSLAFSYHSPRAIPDEVNPHISNVTRDIFLFIARGAYQDHWYMWRGKLDNQLWHVFSLLDR